MSRHDLAEAAVCFISFGFLIFGFPYLITFLLHITGRF